MSRALELLRRVLDDPLTDPDLVLDVIAFLAEHDEEGEA